MSEIPLHELQYIPGKLLHKSIAGRYRPVRVAGGPVTGS